MPKSSARIYVIDISPERGLKGLFISEFRGLPESVTTQGILLSTGLRQALDADKLRFRVLVMREDFIKFVKIDAVMNPPRGDKEKKYKGSIFKLAAGNPMFGLGINEIYYDPEEMKSDYSVVHIRRAVQLPRMREAPDYSVREFSELGIYALIAPYDRIGTATKIMVLQTSTMMCILADLLEEACRNECDGRLKDLVKRSRCVLPKIDPYKGKRKAVAGDTLLALIGLARDFATAYSYFRLISSLETTAVWKPKSKDETEQVLDTLTKIIDAVIEQGYGAALNIHPCIAEALSLSPPCRGNDGGRLSSMVYGRVVRKFNSIMRSLEESDLSRSRERVCHVIDWTEQMGPVDAALTLITNHILTSGSRVMPEHTVIAATPLSFTNAFVAASYLQRVGRELGEGAGAEIVMTSGTDPVGPAATAKYVQGLFGGDECETVVYHAGGPTAHTLIMSYELSKWAGAEGKDLIIIPQARIPGRSR